MKELKEIFAIVNQIKRLLHSLEKISTPLCFFFFSATLFIKFSEQFFGKVGFDAINSTFCFFFFIQ